MVLQRTADCVVGMLEQFSRANLFRRYYWLNLERNACEGCEALVSRLTGNIAEYELVERILQCYISLIARGVVVFSGIDQAVHVVVVVGVNRGFDRAVDDDVVVVFRC